MLESRQRIRYRGLVTLGPSNASSRCMAKILLVSRDGAARETLRDLLCRRGHALTARPTIAETGWPAFRARWDAAFVDLSGEGEEGLAMVATARQYEPAMRITVLDEGGDSPGLHRLAYAVSLGAEEFVCKPIDRHDANGVLDRLGL